MKSSDHTIDTEVSGQVSKVSRQYPEGWPNNCPPSDAVDANGDYFRLVFSDPPSKRDFQSYAELGLRHHEDECLRCGLSVFRAASDAARLYRYMRKRHPKGVNLGHLVARLELSSVDGKTGQTRRQAHFTWWPYAETNRATTFRSIVMDSSNAMAS